MSKKIKFEPEAPCCPYCGFNAEKFYFRNGECIGCEGCIDFKFWDDLEGEEL